MDHVYWPITPEAMLPFLATVLLIELTPGPNMAYLAALSATSGRVAGLRCVAGVTLGLSVYMLAAVVGLAEAVSRAPLVYGVLRWSGVAFLFYLAWEAWRGSDAQVDEASATAPFWRGFIANLLNPKAALFYVTLLPSFVAADHAPFWLQALLFGLLHITVSVLVHGTIVLSAAGAGDFLARAGVTTNLRRAAAIGIALIAIWLVLETA